MMIKMSMTMTSTIASSFDRVAYSQHDDAMTTITSSFDRAACSQHDNDDFVDPAYTSIRHSACDSFSDEISGLEYQPAGPCQNIARYHHDYGHHYLAHRKLFGYPTSHQTLWYHEMLSTPSHTVVIMTGTRHARARELRSSRTMTSL